jgi:hypothetical protein
MKFRSVLIAVALLLACATLSMAQPINPPSTEAYAFKIYAPAATEPTSTTPLVNTDIVCDQAPAAPGASTVNPTRAEWDDPARQGRKCVWTQGTGNLLVALPIGSYEGAIELTTAAGPSGDSNRAPFSRQALPGARTGFRIVR